MQVLPVLSEQLEQVHSELLKAFYKCCDAPRWDALLKDLTSTLDEVHTWHWTSLCLDHLNPCHCHALPHNDQ